MSKLLRNGLPICLLLTLFIYSLMLNISVTKPEAWSVKITIQGYDGAELIGSAEVTFGFHPNATDDYDEEFDEPAPPEPMEGVYAYIYNPIPTESELRKLKVDVRAPLAEGESKKTWKLKIKYIKDGPVSGNITLTWNLTEVAQVPAQYRLILNYTGTIVDMRTTNKFGIPIEYTEEEESKTVTVYIKVYVGPAFEVTPEKSEKVVWVGETATHVFTIKNTGGVADTYTITTDLGTLNVTSLTLNPGETGYFSLTYTPTAPGVYVANITVKSTADPTLVKTVKAITYAWAKVYNFTVDVNATTATVKVGRQVAFEFTITNTGNVTDTYTITTNRGNLTKTSITLDPGKSDTFLLTFKSYTAGTYTITVTVKSTGDPTKVKTIDLTVEVVELVIEFEVTPTESELEVYEGETAIHNFTITNKGEVEDTYTITTNLGNLTKTSITLAPGASDTFSLTFKSYEAGTYVATITITSTRKPTLVKTVTARTIVRKAYEFTVTPSLSYKPGVVNTAVVHTFNLTNTGVVTDTYTITTTGGTLSLTTVTLAPGESRTFTLTVTYATAGVYKENITVTSTGKPTLTVTVQARTAVAANKTSQTLATGETKVITSPTGICRVNITTPVTKPVTIEVFELPENPAPEAPGLPEKVLPKFIDVVVSDKTAVSWPIRIEVTYTDEEVRKAGISKDTLALYHWNGTHWVKFRETGVDPDRNIIWANAYQDELNGVPVAGGGRMPPPVGGEVKTVPKLEVLLSLLLSYAYFVLIGVSLIIIAIVLAKRRK